MENAMKKKILFLCTGNSCRSQMAEGWARALRSADIEPYSAGVVRHGMNPDAVRVMQEAGVDITVQSSKTVDELPVKDFDLIVTLCGHAAETCPYFPGSAERRHIPFDDPPALAREAAAAKADAHTELSEDERLAPYRRVRDEIRAMILSL